MYQLPSETGGQRAYRWFLVFLTLVSGIFFTVGGAVLLIRGGSWYYVIMGVTLLVATTGLWKRRAWGADLYLLALLGTMVWAVYDAGWEFWPLFSRIFAFLVLGFLIALLYPRLYRSDPPSPASHGMARGAATILGIGAVVAFASIFWPKGVTTPGSATQALAPDVGEPADWTSWAANDTGNRFSAADQINLENIERLEVAWVAHTGHIPESTGAGAEDQNTPIQIGESLYVCTAYSKVLSLDVDTGKEKWTFDPEASSPAWQRCRGLAYLDTATSPARAAPVPGRDAADAASETSGSMTTAERSGSPSGQDTGQQAQPQVQDEAESIVESGVEQPAPEASATPTIEDAPAAQTTDTRTTGDTLAGTSLQCARRLFLPTIDARLIALDADTGQPCADFGNAGTVDLTVGMGHVPDGWYQQTSPPLVAEGLVIVGGRVADNYSTDEPSGVVRGFDAYTGELMWAWDPGNPIITGLPPEGQTYTRNSPNVWAGLSYDPQLGLAYMGTGNATPDFYGGQRTEQMDATSSSIVALDVRTGKVVWLFQTVYHDLWDFDVPAQPVLADVPDGQGGTLPALLQVTKQGEIFMLNRQTGEPIAPVEERQVPIGEIPGERYSPVQPYSVGMPSIGNETLTESDMWGGTAFDLLLCRIAFKGLTHQGLFTPPGMGPTLQFPGSLGGMNWGSASIDTNRHYMFVNDMRLGLFNYMIPRDQMQEGASGIEMGAVPQEGTPFGAMRQRFLSPLGIPCNKPPFGTMTAIDLQSRQIVWQVPVGTVKETGPFNIPMLLPVPVGMPTLGPSLATQGGLLFFAGTQDFYLRAWDSATGEEIWKGELPVGSQGGPMTYVSPKTGRQYVVITAGGARQSPKRGDYVIAFALPEE